MALEWNWDGIGGGGWVWDWNGIGKDGVGSMDGWGMGDG